MKRLLLSILLIQSSVFAAVGESHARISNRTYERTGVTFGFLGSPFPQALGVGLAYNAFDFLQLNLLYGAGYASSIGLTHSLAVGPTLLVPHWTVSPAVGFYWATTFGAPTTSDNVFGKDDHHLLAALGLDWQTEWGFGVTTGLNVPLEPGSPTGPYLRLGYFF